MQKVNILAALRLLANLCAALRNPSLFFFKTDAGFLSCDDNCDLSPAYNPAVFCMKVSFEKFQEPDIAAAVGVVI